MVPMYRCTFEVPHVYALASAVARQRVLYNRGRGDSPTDTMCALGRNGKCVGQTYGKSSTSSTVVLPAPCPGNGAVLPAATLRWANSCISSSLSTSLKALSLPVTGNLESK